MDKTKKQSIIKNLIIIFLLALLLLVLFSNTIMNYSLAEVETKTVESGTITEQIRTTGIVQTIETYNVVLDQTREIESVEISPGDEVKTGDVLFTLTDTESEELKQARTELEQMKLEYETALLDGELPSYAADNAEVQALQNALSLAIEERSKLGSTSMTLTEAQAQLNAAQYEVDSRTGTVTDIQTKITQIDNNDSAYSGIRGEVLALEAARNALTVAQAAYDNMVAKSGSQTAESGATESIYSSKELQKAYDKVTAAQDQVNSCTEALNSKKESEKLSLVNELDIAQDSLNAANASFLSAQSTYNMVSNIKNAEAAVTEARNSLNSKILNLKALHEEDEINQEKGILSLEAQEIKIEEKEEEIKKMEESLTGTQVAASQSGIVSSVQATAGMTATKADILATIEVTDLGYEAKISVLSEYADSIEEGMPVDISKESAYGTAITAEITGIRNDTENTGNKIVTLKVEGDVTVGESLTFTVPLSSANYDSVVPKNSIHTDESGDFVFVITTKKTPLGNRYMATRILVQVLASDDTQAAVTGVSAGSSVITISSAVITPGDYVRFSGNQRN